MKVSQVITEEICQKWREVKCRQLSEHSDVYWIVSATTRVGEYSRDVDLNEGIWIARAMMMGSEMAIGIRSLARVPHCCVDLANPDSVPTVVRFFDNYFCELQHALVEENQNASRYQLMICIEEVANRITGQCRDPHAPGQGRNALRDNLDVGMVCRWRMHDRHGDWGDYEGRNVGGGP